MRSVLISTISTTWQMEALWNAASHARAQHIEPEIAYSDKFLRVRFRGRLPLTLRKAEAQYGELL